MVLQKYDIEVPLYLYSLIGVYFVCAVVISSIIVDKVGYNFLWMKIGISVIVISSFFWFWVPAVPYYITVAFLETGYAITIVPGFASIPFVLKKRMWGRGFGYAIFSISTAKALSITLLITLNVDEISIIAVSFLVLSTIVIS